jgi:hypothetical protein
MPTVRSADHSWGVQPRGPRSQRHMHRLAWHSPTLGRALTGAHGAQCRAFVGRSNHVGVRSQRRTRRLAWHSILRWGRTLARMRFSPAARSTRLTFHFSPVGSRSQRRTRTARAAEHSCRIQIPLGRALNGELARRAPPSMLGAFKFQVGSRSQRRTRRCAWRSILRWIALSPANSHGARRRACLGRSNHVGRALTGICTGLHGIVLRWVVLSAAYAHGAQRRPFVGRSNPVGSRSHRRTRLAWRSILRWPRSHRHMHRLACIYPALGSRFHAHALSRAALTRAAFHFSPVASRVAGVRAQRRASH